MTRAVGDSGGRSRAMGGNLPTGREREHVWVRDRCHMLRGSESRTLASVGAFRVIPASDLRDTHGKTLDPRHGELWHLREAGLVQTVRIDRDTTGITLTYRLWKLDGEAALVSIGSHAIREAVEAGQGRIEVLELGHRYGHLSPLAAVS